MTGTPDDEHQTDAGAVAAAPEDASGGLFLLGIMGSFLLAPVGLVVGIVLLTRRHVGRALTCIGLSVVIMTVGLLAVFKPWESAELDTARLEAAIARWAEDNSSGDIRASVDCPDSMPMERGATYRCIVSDQDGNTVRVVVTVENDDGEVTWVTG